MFYWVIFDYEKRKKEIKENELKLDASNFWDNKCNVPEINRVQLNNTIIEELKKILWGKYYKLGKQQKLLSEK